MTLGCNTLVQCEKLRLLSFLKQVGQARPDQETCQGAACPERRLDLLRQCLLHKLSSSI